MRSNELDTLQPPADLAAAHGGDQFRELGHHWLQTFKLLAGLRPHDDVLDVGCGAGRMALALSAYLTTGRYEGFDINARDIEWCKGEIEPRWPLSRFRLVDVSNKTYNPTGSVPGHRFRFPYDDSTFDFVFLTSVFTHMLPEDILNYLSEISRVLKPGGRCLITYFILTAASRQAINENKARFEFRHQITPGAHAQYRDRPEEVIAYDEAFLRKEYLQRSLQIAEPIHFGAWSGAPLSPAPRHTQDVIVALKPE